MADESEPTPVAAEAGPEAGGQGAQPGELIVIPVRDVVLLPGTVMPIGIGRAVSIAAAQQAVREERQIGVLMQRDPKQEDPTALDLHRTGAVANILRYISAPDGTHHIVLQGEQRFRVIDFVSERPVIVARVQRFADPETLTPEIEARFRFLQQQAAEAFRLMPQAPRELIETVESIPSPGALADVVAAYLDIGANARQELLETFDVVARIEKVTKLLGERLEVLRLTHEIGQQTKAAFDERQREAILREQMAAIQRQLGEGDGRADEVREIGEKIARANMPKEVEDQARKELARYQRMSEGSGEAGPLRTYLDWLTELPWALPEPKPIDIAEARRILDADHFGLAKIKQRIVEYLAVRKLAPGGKAPILCFAGPPGVGKTSLGQSIARALGRAFVRVSLGGVHDEAEIRGHRRTYIGAMPGNIIQAIRKAGSRDCVLMLDEIDKMGAGIHGDPAAAMLEVLDPEQNFSFRDNYLGQPFDLSHVVFIATANMLESIPGPLRDRMEIITLAGYTEDEKFEIARRYLVARQLEANGLTAEQVRIDDETLKRIIRDYTREAGVRGLEREIGRALRHAAMKIAEGSAEHVEFGAGDLAAILGPALFENETAMRTSVPGVATGLAWTPVGGDILFIEAARAPGRGGLTLTGQLGEVMRESAQAALTLVRSQAASFGVAPDIFEKSDIHIHVPAGATPKDGPSAGVAMFIALVSLLSNRTVRSDTAMTGEISLRGLVLPVGGIKEKVTAAARAGLKRVMLPARNRRDYDDIPEDARKSLEFVWLERVEDAVAAAFESDVAPEAAHATN
ncbi:endopeptidase La [Rhodoblastus acidophilus]|uniref:Lon protease n=1 Tax=Candidatus Rhodoblastus alkanivorans TaxID=2954117 RepID=A0ABS9Z738_9HYPH|nr:endopeptidase La [Candidatus Rhodoblastus alkanivorans]MCI4679601.1 endopeptidase La [Candidatus Rhodoblastus alkanivorans]MCI4683426.1 endopeptidase La [Candidatus Rhodoblastus alkanivorans]MDI4640736.1 endopeptidase La [Rhodoblastus acidophilus]